MRVNGASPEQNFSFFPSRTLNSGHIICTGGGTPLFYTFLGFGSSDTNFHWRSGLNTVGFKFASLFMGEHSGNLSTLFQRDSC